MKTTAFLALSALVAASGVRAQMDVHPDRPANRLGNTSAIFASPLAMGIMSGMADMPVVSAAYEHRLTESGYSLFIPLHGAYNQQDKDVKYAAGLGLGLRKYFGADFAGSYLTAQSDLLGYKTDRTEYTPATQDANGFWHGGDSKRVPYKDYLSVTQLAYGYKWGWRQFTLDLSVGGAFYAKRDEKFTNVIGGVNLGFPFGAKAFDIH